jgi:hypothetical protein
VDAFARNFDFADLTEGKKQLYEIFEKYGDSSPSAQKTAP